MIIINKFTNIPPFLATKLARITKSAQGDM